MGWKVPEARILVVDDSSAMRQCLRRVLESEDRWRVCEEASNGREALEKVEQSSPDIVLLDLQMPVMNGLEAAREIRRRSPELPILMVSLHMSPDLGDEARKAGIDGTCGKNDMECLVEAVHTLLRQGTYYRD